jgi:hypothetical protein
MITIAHIAAPAAAFGAARRARLGLLLLINP